MHNYNHHFMIHLNRSVLRVQSVLVKIVIILFVFIVIIIILIVIIIIVSISTQQLLLHIGMRVLCSDQDNYVISLFLDPLLSSLKLISSYPIILKFHLKLTGYCGLTGMMCVLAMIVTAQIIR